ncbi:ABC-2 type transporter domain-containing protein [Trichoderma breve]|uniref:ABC-2 type transporter domain-containing protein n=1 Tax=Trichoderma breve TaxID=2034170 RepID=A0A9W9E5T4_9HYPO|nr:ABC-2 type transporter domain-containing protein [Trichoderma breve]KAJ4855726.1 ABC-2 type transporter domain-containing protein [Trichoderma breve]
MAHHEDGKEVVDEGLDISTHRPFSTVMEDDERSKSPIERDPRETHSRDSDNDASTFPSALSRTNTYDEESMEQEDKTELKRIATALSRRQSQVAAPARRQSTGLGTVDEYDATLDPDRREFDLSKWLLRFIRELNEKGLADRQIGVSFRNLDVFGSGSAIQLQNTVGSVLTAPLRLGEFFSFGKKEPKHILHNFNGLVKSGELLVVLGRPGSGCSTLLKSICGELHGLNIGEKSAISYNGIPQKQMKKEFRGEAIYNQEVDRHFPHLTVGQTLEFAASVRTPSHRAHNMPRAEYCRYIAKVVMAAFGLSHTYNTKVGDDFIRGVSGGERKRVSIAEMVLAGSPFSAWDNSTRGLDSATAFKFVKALRNAADLGNLANAVAIYQASQAIYDLFDKATVLYDGRQIYFGPASKAKAYFERQGWYCPPRQTTGDFLTSVTNPVERQARQGMEMKVPRTPEDFERLWLESPEFRALQKDLDRYEEQFGGERQGESLAHFRQQKNLRQAKRMRPKSPYIISIPMQVKFNTKRAYQRIWNDIYATMASTVVQIVMALIIGSIFFDTPNNTDGFYAKGSRPIVEKHASYAFYHPATEAAAGIAADIPIKFITASVFNIILYFMSGLRRTPSQFFIYYLIGYVSIFVMSAIFRTMAAITRTVSQAMSLAGILVLALVIYTGFTITVPTMHPWFSWIRWINPIYYAFEILVANEFHGQDFPCGSSFVPPYNPTVGDSFICPVAGAVAGSTTVSGDAFIATNYEYYYSHVWRNFGILMGFLFFFMAVYFIATELNSSTSSTAEALVFRRGHVPAHIMKGESGPARTDDGVDEKGLHVVNTNANINGLEPQTDLFTWRNVVYDIKIKSEDRRLLDHVSGWVKPGTLTALMGVSGAGKTTLLDVLAQRTTMGVITGDMLVNGRPRDLSFQRKTGYVQQQDLHLETATVRESLRFSAMLRQPKSVPKAEKYAFVEEVIKMLNMEEFANAVVGVPGEGLNVEQRKLLTIGVELAAKPKLLLFLDEPTSGLDSQSSAILFQTFDRLLFLAKGGKTVYFGNIGDNSHTLLNYFEEHGARKCGDEENPAEYMLEIVNNGVNDKGEDWPSVWKSSSEFEAVQTELDRLHEEKLAEGSNVEDASSQSEFATPFATQLWEVTYRIFQQYWRLPSYIFAKFLLGIAAGLFIGFSFFNANSSLAGMQNVIFSVFMVTTIFSTIVQQIQPLFVTQRSLYEVRERPSKAYSWKAFILANVFVEIPYQIIMGILVFACFYYPVVGIQSSIRQILVLLFIMQLFIFASSFAHMIIVAMPDAQTASAIVTFLVLMSTLFNGVLQVPSALPGFWLFMWRVSVFTYWVAGIVATELHGRQIICSQSELSIFNPPSGQTCGEYLAPFLQQAPGQLQNPSSTTQCAYCQLSNADQYLAGSEIFWSDRWRNYGIVWAYIVFNIFTAITLYYLFRVKKWNNLHFRLPWKKASKQ